MLKTYMYLTTSFQHSVSILTNILAFFVKHLLKIGIIPSPAFEAKTNENHNKKFIAISRRYMFPVVSNEEIQELNSVALNKHTCT